MPFKNGNLNSNFIHKDVLSYDFLYNQYIIQLKSINRIEKETHSQAR
jgi:hypothetical protein